MDDNIGDQKDIQLSPDEVTYIKNIISNKYTEHLEVVKDLAKAFIFLNNKMSDEISGKEL